MDLIYNAMLYVLLFVVLKTIQIAASFAYTTYKSLRIHKSWAHAFNPGLRYRLRSGLIGDAVYFAAGIFIASQAGWLRGLA